MNFDNLDDDLDIGYTPTIASNSRSAGMKKIARKSQQKPAPINTKKNNDFDLLDQLLASPAKVPNKSVPDKTKNITTTNANTKKNNNDIDDFFDEPTLPLNNKPSNQKQKIQIKATSSVPPVATINKPLINPIPISLQDPIVEQQSTKPSKNLPAASSFKFKRPQTAVNISTTKVQQQQPQITISPSLRMMKPPLRKRQSKDETSKTGTQEPKISMSVGGIGLGLTLPDLENKTALTINNNQSNAKEEQNKFKMPLNSKRRSSIQVSSSQLNLNAFGDDNANKKNNMNLPNNANSYNTQPKLNLFNTVDNSKAKEKEKQKQQNYSLKLQIKPQQKIQAKKQPWQPQKSIMIEQQQQLKTQPYWNQAAPSYPSLSQKHQQIEKQLQFIKKNYQKHIDSLQKNLEDQIKVNKDTRQRLMKECNTMIENQRQRMKKMHEEDLDRVKQLGVWETKKMEEQYKRQIQSLKLRLQHQSSTPAQTHHQLSYLKTQENRQQLQYLQERIQSQRKLLDQKSKLLDRRQLELQEKQKQFLHRKRLEEEKLRNEQKRLYEYQLECKRIVSNERRNLENQKQQAATQFATLQMDNYKKYQNIQLIKREIDRERQIIQRERNQTRNMMNNMLLQYQKKNQQLRKQKQRISKMQHDLVQKIRIVQAQASRIKGSGVMAKTKQNNWVAEKTNNTTLNPGPRQMKVDQQSKKLLAKSMQKQAQHKKLETTQNRFNEMAANIKQSFKNSHNNHDRGRQFNLDNYLMSMAHYTRGREAIH